MSAVELLAAGPKAPSGTSDAVDVSVHSQLRLTIDPRGTDLGRDPVARVWIETSRDGVSGWTIAHEALFHYVAGSNHPFEARRVNLGNVDAYARVRWQAQGAGSTTSDPGLMLAVTGDGVPDAE